MMGSHLACAVLVVTQPGCGEQGVGPQFAAGRLVGTGRAHQKGVEDDIQERAMSAEIRPDVAFLGGPFPGLEQEAPDAG